MLGDTIIASVNYKKIYSKYATWMTFAPSAINFSNYIGAMRQDIPTKKIFYVNYGNTSEDILYDFDLSIGDTVNYNTSYGDTVFVTGVDSTLVGGVYHKSFLLASTSFATSALIPGKLIEGVGSAAGLINLYTGGFEFSNQLLCLSINSNLVYPSGVSSFPSNYCAYAVGIGELENNELKMTVMPNPVVNDIHIMVSCNDKYDIEIRNALGELIYIKTAIQANGPTIDFSNFSNGIYFVRLNDSKGNSIVKKIVKN